jgi:hypothetical protein
MLEQNVLHLWTFKTPTKWAVVSDKDDADWALSVPNGVNGGFTGACPCIFLSQVCSMEKLLVIGSAILFFYSLSKVMNFWGMSEDVYGVYIMFYSFLILTSLVLPLQYNTPF